MGLHTPGTAAVGALLPHRREKLAVHAPDLGVQRGDQRVQPHQGRLCGPRDNAPVKRKDSLGIGCGCGL